VKEKLYGTRWEFTRCKSVEDGAYEAHWRRRRRYLQVLAGCDGKFQIGNLRFEIRE
jgi:hypothetical protein